MDLKNPKNKVKVIFESSNAAESVTGSCTLIDLGECKEKILVECGLI